MDTVTTVQSKTTVPHGERGLLQIYSETLFQAGKAGVPMLVGETYVA
jgi:hypothetical protein